MNPPGIQTANDFTRRKWPRSKHDMRGKDTGPLGILSLGDPEIPPAPVPGGFVFPNWFDYPVIIKKVPGAWARDVVGGKTELTEAYVRSAQELQSEGAVAITARCGYAVIYQKAVSDAVSVPVACSSLMQLPLIRSMLPADGRIGLLVFDRPRLTSHHLRCAGADESTLPVVIEGIQGTESWKNWIGEVTKTDWDVLDRDVMNAARRLWKSNPDITHWVLECADFPRFRSRIRDETGRPVFDWLTLCDYLMASVD